MTGRVVGHYRVLDRIGAGGMGVVYSADDTRLQRRVALKFPPAEFLSDPAARERLFAEARAASALDHPNICTIHAIEELSATELFIVMAEYDGETLKTRLERGALPIDEALSIAEQVARGLSRAHGAGIVHRDIKPANIMLTASGVVKILDFGLAVDPALTIAGDAVWGTLAYMSPEQASGEPLDAGGDIWALGAILYEMLAGRPPFEADSARGVLAAIMRAQPRPLAEARADVPRDAARVVTRALAPERTARYGTVDELLADLEAARKGSGSGPAAVTGRIPSIAVLPFSDVSPSKDHDWFCEGVAEELINALAGLEHLRVVARTSSFQFKGQSLDVRAIGERLNVATVLEGSVRKAGSRLRITAQLIDVATGFHLFSERYDRDMDDVFAVQDEIATTVVEKLRVRLTGEEAAEPIVKRHTARPEAYQKYLEGRYFWARRHTGAFEKAIQCFTEAAAIDPEYALAYAGIADAYSILGLYGLAPVSMTGPKAIEAAERALDLDPELADAHAALGLAMWTQQRKWHEAVPVYERALELNPQAHTARGQLASVLLYTGRFDEGLRESQAAFDAEPLSLVLAFYYTGNLYLTRRYEQAIAECERLLGVHSEAPLLLLIYGGSLYFAGRYDEALDVFARMGRVTDSIMPLASRAAVLARMGRRSEADAAIAEFEARGVARYASPIGMADFYAALDDADRAIMWLQRAWEAGDGFFARAALEPDYDFLRYDPRFVALMTEAGLMGTVIAADALRGKA